MVPPAQALAPNFNGGAGTSVMVGQQQRKILDAMYAMAAKPSSEGYHALSMTKAVERLRAGGDLPNAQYQPHRPSRRCLVHSGFEIEYEVVPGVFGQGAIEIVEIRLLKQEVKNAKRAGLWKVSVRKEKSRSQEKWDAEQWLPDLSTVPDNSAIKVGVNGYFKDMKAASNFMPSHLCRGSASKERALEATGYHLFYSPSKSVVKAGWESIMHSISVLKNDNQENEAAILAAYMQEAHNKQLKVEWTSHRGGSYTLTEAMKLLANKNVDLQKRQSIFLSDNSTSHAVADNYRRKLNMDISEPQWVNAGFGIGYAVGGGQLGFSGLSNSLTVLMKDTPKEQRPGKLYQLGNDAFSVATKNHGIFVGSLVAWSGFGVTAASALVAGKILEFAASSIPALTNKYQTRSDQASAELLNRSLGKLLGRD
ncbi:hypothetical protein L1F30_11935 [Simiduia sp. 21SJ11W-1]|uniref:hypothetical protein n=1 Tax=Simiduia sp. 21SJ11W-1 TaxID=2909669 RepID=UPI00209F67F4|nr:hypothetical protein [Simiduia sp. 21SJ11W-1]UTA46871.1 hypothetical protein L1F30_11935 [Simiduia sp. 21SJ11W-1]